MLGESTNAHVQGSQNHTRHTCSDRRTKQGIGRVGVRGGVTQDDVVDYRVFPNGKKPKKYKTCWKNMYFLNSEKKPEENSGLKTCLLDGCKACLSGFPVWLSL